MTEQKKEILFKKFEIISCYKKNEHSAVYLANHIFLEKKVFLKVLNTSTIPDSSITERFKREAKILAQLEHPNIIKVFDFGMFEEFFYISFEYFESKNLRVVLNTSELSDEINRALITQLVKGLNFIHQNDVIHRDLKPENILVNENYELKLTDFGLAQNSLESTITQMYSVVGTPAYMSPEQIQGEKLTVQSDIFSLGINIYELIKTKNPFLGDDSNSTLNNIISFDEQQNDNLFLGFPIEMEKILRGSLIANPEDRFTSCKYLLEILNIKEEKSHIVKSKKNSSVLILSAILVSVIILFFYFNQSFSSDVNNIDQKTHNISTTTDSLLNTQQIGSAEIKSINEKPNQTIEESKEISSTKKDKIAARISPIIISTENELGQLFIKCYPWAKVYLNDKFIETTPFTENIELESGKTLIKLEHPDYPVYLDSISILPGELSFVEVNLDTLFGFLDCKIYPWGKITINGEDKGTTPLENPIKLGQGKYKIEVSNPSFNSIEKTFNIERNNTLVMKVNMELGTIN